MGFVICYVDVNGCMFRLRSRYRFSIGGFFGLFFGRRFVISSGCYCEKCFCSKLMSDLFRCCIRKGSVLMRSVDSR